MVPPPDPAARRSRLVTVVLVAACVAVGAAAALPRLGGQVRPPSLETPDLTVHVHGEVARPGTHVLPWGARVADLVAAAGGLTDQADAGLVALAAPLTDGVTVVVPSRRSAHGDEGRVDVNTASVRLLTTLPGVGPVMAERIVAGRPYHRPEDLLRVPGIGPARLEALRGRITL